MMNKRDRRHSALLFILCASLLTLSLAASRSLLNGREPKATVKEQREETRAAKRAKDAPAPTENSSAEAARRASTIEVSESPSALELAHRVDRAIDESEVAQARWGVFVVSLRDGRVLYSRDGDKPITPASNMKVYTTAVALDLLGADYRWRTSVYAKSGPDKSGTIAGDLILYGRGAPDLMAEARPNRTASLAQLADDLYNRGVRRIQGNVVGDESYFRGEPLGDGWLWNDVQWYFGAEVSALTINNNETTVTLTPGNKVGEPVGVRFNPPGDYLRVLNDANTMERGTPTTVGLTRGLSDNEFRVWGNFPVSGRGFSARLSVHKPALWAATLFRNALKARGINVDGEARSSDERSGPQERFDPQAAIELASALGKTLGEIVRATNKESINLNAELILRTLGRERGSMAPDSDPQRNARRNDDQAGTAVIRLWLERAGIKTEGLALHDGSGLSRLDLVTPAATSRLLAAIAKTASANIFRDSLPVAGRDGTLGGRLRSSAGRIAAKTGTLTYTNSLSGYATTEDGEPLAFSIICNNETTEANSIRVIDAIASLLAAYSESRP